MAILHLTEALSYACVAGVAIGLFAALRLVARPGEGERAERFLGLLILLCAGNVVHGMADFRPLVDGPFVLEPLQFILPLGIVWYLRTLRGGRILALPDAVNIVLPAIFIAGSYAPGVMDARLPNRIPIFCLVMWLTMDASSALLLLPLARDIHRYRNDLKGEYSSLKGIDPGWLQLMLVLMGLLFFLYALLSVLMVHAPADLPQRTILAALMSAFTIFLSWLSLGRKRLPRRVGRGEEPGPELPDPELREEARRLRELMESERLYLLPELSLDDLARAAGLTRHQASAVLNRGLKSGFFDLVNQYRVEEYKRLCREDSRAGDKIMTLALESGFNSKPNFNLIFKKATGLTPSQYRKSAAIESRPDA
jgi:AraC-like DNA-binding protein